MIFYISVLPSVIELTEVSVFYGVQIISTVGLAVMTGLVVISLLGKQLKSLISTPGMAKRVNRICGTMMIAVGLTLVFV